MRTRLGAALATTLVCASVAAHAAPASASAGAITAPAPSSPCLQYAEKNLSGETWACVGDKLLHLSRDGSNFVTGSTQLISPRGVVTAGDPAEPASVQVGESSSSEPSTSGMVTPLSIVDAYHDNAAVVVGGNFGGRVVSGGVSLKTTLKNHTPVLGLRYSGDPAFSLTFRIKIMRDNSVALDDRILTYDNVYGSSTYRTLWTGADDGYGEAYNVLPYDGAKYFVELIDGVMGANGGRVSLGSILQSDRMTCYKTISCTFPVT